jgi:hypothetical protein
VCVVGGGVGQSGGMKEAGCIENGAKSMFSKSWPCLQVKVAKLAEVSGMDHLSQL